MSRIRKRTAIDGAKTIRDFLDQDHLWWRKWQKIDGNFVNMEDPRDYEYLSAQAVLTSLAEAGERITEPRESRIREIFASVSERYNPNQQDFFSTFFFEVKEVYPYFSSRDIRNIQSAIDGRIMDFDFPEEWMEDPETFFRVNYDLKIEMLKDLMRVNMRGLSFAEVRLEEAIRYVDNMVRIADSAKSRAIEAEVERLETHSAALKKVQGRET
jgi:hypothetical protein